MFMDLEDPQELDFAELVPRDPPPFPKDHLISPWFRPLWENCFTAELSGPIWGKLNIAQETGKGEAGVRPTFPTT